MTCSRSGPHLSHPHYFFRLSAVDDVRTHRNSGANPEGSPRYYSPLPTTRGLSERRFPTRAVSGSRGAAHGP
jgi:hypothetical protein